MKLESLLSNGHGVPCVIPAVVSSYIVCLGREQIDHTAFPLIAPLCADNDI
jgi:hypothetical protein